jgi:FkbM family methyltransferase
MDRIYVTLYRLYRIAKRSVIDVLLRRWPVAERAFAPFKRFVTHRFLRGRAVWAQVESGLSKGMWMRLRIPQEAGFLHGEHEPDVQDLIVRMLQPGGCLYDIGSHLGSISLGAARLVGESGRVVAFEGDPDNALILQQNCVRNHLQSNLQVVHAAVWSSSASEGILFRKAAGRTYGGVEVDGHSPVLGGDGPLIRVPVITLDDFAAAGGPLPQLIKIDVEGGEHEVLRGGSLLFEKQRPLVIVEVHHQRAADEILRWLQEFRYSGEWNIPKQNFPRRLIAWPSERRPNAC